MDIYFKLYIRDVIALMRGLRIKSETTAMRINTRLSQLGYGVDESDQRTWKYYLNLNGEYHVADEAMTIISHDTYETIPFTKASLQVHRSTAADYAVGSRYYRELRARYPNQESLIQGIIDTVDIDVAILTDDHKILSYPGSLRQSNEIDLIPLTQKYIDQFFALRHNPDYMLFEPHYYTKLLSGLATKLVLELIRLRLEACKTDQAHYYHVRQYLMSFSAVGSEFDYMTHEQRMWLYRNIRQLNRNIGQQQTFDRVTKKIMTDRGYSMVRYHLAQNSEFMPEEVTPRIIFGQEIINGIPPASGVGDKTVETLITDEIPLAPGNQVVHEDTIANVHETADTSLNGRQLTKVIESDVIDRTDSDPFTLSDIALHHWIYLSHFRRYNAVTQVTNPGNGDRYNLSMKDAFVLYLYAYNRALGIELPTVPVLSANRVLRDPLPDFQELRNLAEKRHVPDYYINHILDTQPVLGTYISIEAFRNFCKNVWEVLFRHRELRFFSSTYMAEGYLNTLVDRCYMDIRIDLAGEMPYPQWLSERGISLDGLTDFDLMAMAQGLLEVCTGANLADATSLKEIHRAMLRIMRTLSSYSVQFIPKINDSTIKVINGKFPMLGDMNIESLVTHVFDMHVPEVLHTHTRHRTRHALPATTGILETKIDSGSTHFELPVLVKLLNNCKDRVEARVPLHAPVLSIHPMAAFDLPSRIDVANPYRPTPSSGTGGVYPAPTDYQIPPERLNAFLNRG